MKFEALIDVRRPHTLLTEDTMGVTSLMYRYDDSGDVVCVPNRWFNQTFVDRVEYINSLANREEERARSLSQDLDDSAYGKKIAALVTLHRARAKVIREEAKRIGAQAKPEYPVAASRLPLNIGPEVED